MCVWQKTQSKIEEISEKEAALFYNFKGTLFSEEEWTSFKQGEPGQRATFQIVLQVGV